MCPKMQIMVLWILLINRLVMNELKTNKQTNIAKSWVYSSVTEDLT